MEYWTLGFLSGINYGRNDVEGKDILRAGISIHFTIGLIVIVIRGLTKLLPLPWLSWQLFY